MSFAVEVLPTDGYASSAAETIAGALPQGGGSFVLTGGRGVRKIYPALAELSSARIAELEILFSDERCVPPDHDESNFKMADDLLLQPTGARRVHRMRGEDPPEQAAASYSNQIAPLVEQGLDLMLLGMGTDAHIGAMFPGSAALRETRRLCHAVPRPDGMTGLTLTPPALISAKTILLLVGGHDKAAAVARVIKGSEPVEACPARLLAGHPKVTFLLDEPAASAL